MTKKQTSDRVSRIAARVMRILQGWPRTYSVTVLGGYGGKLRIGDVVALAASALGQDEVKGPAKGKRKRARK